MKAIVVEFHDIAPEVRHFLFEVPEVAQLHFKPGQFVSFNETLNGKKITRPYSIVSLPQGNRFELCLNLVQGGVFTPHLFELQPGDSIETSAPLGFFVIRDPAKEAVFIATGTGIAPFRAMAPDYLSHPHANQLTLLFGVRLEHTIYYRGDFEALARKHPNFRFWPTLSRPVPSQGSSAWTGRTGHVQAHLLEAIGERRDVDIYICGLKAMVDDVRAILKGLGFDRKQIIFEKYD
ncbi:MAG TPA: FAD-binding oxidoreductase [Bryobacteraceae bacterium]|nr:FAD-binding oxidoreductase [Bryobacteraceae bacterium]